MLLRCYLKPPETGRYRVTLDAAPYEEAEDGPRFNPMVNGPVIPGQTWRVNSFVPLSALSSRRWVPTLTGSHSTAKSPTRGPGWARLDVIPVYRDSCDFPFGNFSATFKLKTHGINRADLPLLRATSGEARFRNIRGDFPFGKRVPSTVPQAVRCGAASERRRPFLDESGPPGRLRWRDCPAAQAGNSRSGGRRRPPLWGEGSGQDGVVSYPCTGIWSWWRTVQCCPIESETGENRPL